MSAMLKHVVAEMPLRQVFEPVAAAPGIEHVNINITSSIDRSEMPCRSSTKVSCFKSGRP